MAVESQEKAPVAPTSSGRRFRVGTNVLVATVLAIAIVVVAQVIAFRSHQRWDMTSSGINSLSEGTENLLRNLDRNIRLTSLYFETDRETKDQPRYRRAARDLLDLYEATNRAKVRADGINPLKDHEKYRKLIARLRGKTVFREELETYKARIDKYMNEVDPEIRALVQGELDRLSGMGGSLGDSVSRSALGQVENAFHEMSSILDSSREQIETVSLADIPEYDRGINQLRTVYNQLSRTLKNIGAFGASEAQQAEGLSPDQVAFLREAGSRYTTVVGNIEAETTELQGLEPLKFNDLVAQLAPTTNALLVETDDDARVVDFSSVWPEVQQGGDSGFDNRAFKGEEKLTSAILRTTHKEQTAVVFVRYAGPHSFMGGMFRQQPAAPYANMKLQLEDANFIVDEWDLQSSNDPPTIEPTPTRTIYLVLKPTAPKMGPMGRPSQEPPFTDTHRQALLSAIEKDGRALFIAGWHPGPFGPIPSTYEYNDYLNDKWGIKVDTSALLIETINTEPGKYAIGRNDFFSMRKVRVSDHDIVSGALTRVVGLPMCARLELSTTPPDGVEHARLMTVPKTDGLWGETNIQGLMQRARSRQPLAPGEDDLTGPFDLAVAAGKDDAKIVVVSSATFATDNIAFAQAMALTSQGITIRARNPGNVPLLINSLHWLNDNTEFMNIGKPIEAAVLQIKSESTVAAIQALTIFGWPFLALVSGGMVWWVRRR